MSRPHEPLVNGTLFFALVMPWVPLQLHPLSHTPEDDRPLTQATGEVYDTTTRLINELLHRTVSTFSDLLFFILRAELIARAAFSKSDSRMM